MNGGPWDMLISPRLQGGVCVCERGGGGVGWSGVECECVSS